MNEETGQQIIFHSSALPELSAKPPPFRFDRKTRKGSEKREETKLTRKGMYEKRNLQLAREGLEERTKFSYLPYPFTNFTTPHRAAEQTMRRKYAPGDKAEMSKRRVGAP